MTYSIETAFALWLEGNATKTEAEWLFAAHLADYKPEQDGTKLSLSKRAGLIVRDLQDRSGGTVRVPSESTVKQWSAVVTACRDAGYTGGFEGVTFSPATVYKVARQYLRAAETSDEVIRILRDMPEINREYNQRQAGARKAGAAKAAATRHETKQNEVAETVNQLTAPEPEPETETSSEHNALIDKIADALGYTRDEVLTLALQELADANGVEY